MALRQSLEDLNCNAKVSPTTSSPSGLSCPLVSYAITMGIGLSTSLQMITFARVSILLLRHDRTISAYTFTLGLYRSESLSE